MALSRREFVASGLVAGTLVGSADVSAERSLAFGGWAHARYDLENTGYASNERPMAWPFAAAWERSLGGPVSGIAVENDRVYATSESGVLGIFDAASGEEVRRVDVGSPIRTTPMVGQDALYVGADDGIHAVDVGSDVEFWTAGTDGPARSGPKLYEGLVYAGADDGVLYFLEPRTGEPDRELDVGSAIRSAPAIEGNRLYVTNESGYVVGIDIKRQRQLWRTRIGTGATTPVVDGSRIVAGTADGEVVGLDADGSVAWRYQVEDPVAAPPALVGGTAVCITTEGGIFGLDAGGGYRSWQVFVGSEPRAPAVAGDVLYVTDGTNQLYAVDLRDNELVHAHELGATPTAPVPVDGRVFVGVGDRAVAMTERSETPTATPTGRAGGNGGSDTGTDTTGGSGNGTATGTTTGGGGNSGGDDGDEPATETTSDGGIWTLGTLAMAGAGGLGALALYERWTESEE